GSPWLFSPLVWSGVGHVRDGFGILPAGKLVKVAQRDELRRIRVHRVEIEFAPDADVPEGRLRSASGVENLSVSGRVVMCTVHGSFDGLLDAISGTRVVDLVSTEPSLEEFFLTF